MAYQCFASGDTGGFVRLPLGAVHKIYKLFSSLPSSPLLMNSDISVLAINKFPLKPANAKDTNQAALL